MRGCCLKISRPDLTPWHHPPLNLIPQPADNTTMTTVSSENDLFQTILKDHEELASLPQSLSEVLRLSRDPDCSAREMAAVLMRDPGLTTKVLRLANSPYFGAGRQVSSVTQAVMTLGMRAVTALALSASVYDLTGKWAGAVDRLRFWRHSLAVAIGAKGIAEAIRYECPEEAFVAGLLHDIGLLVLEKSFPDRYARLWRQAESGESLPDLEDQVWGTNHARVGQFLLEQWHIPEAICSAVGKHHTEYPYDEHDPVFRLPQVVALANEIAQFTIIKARPLQTQQIDRQDLLRTNLKIDMDRLQKVREDLLARTMQEAAFLDIEIGSNEVLLTEANRILYHQFITLERVLRENRSMQREIARGQLEKSALETLKTITATFNHYINNAVGAILGRAQLVQHDIRKGAYAERAENALQSMDIIVNGVKTIRSVMEELTNLSAFKTTVYYDDTYIIDIENKIKRKIEAIDDVPVSDPDSSLSRQP